MQRIKSQIRSLDRANERDYIEIGKKIYQKFKAGVKAAVRVTIAAVKATIAAVKGLIAAIAAGGWVAVVIILLICLIALIVGSCFVCSGT